jgi:hypothetical protein
VSAGGYTPPATLVQFLLAALCWRPVGLGVSTVPPRVTFAPRGRGADLSLKQ